MSKYLAVIESRNELLGLAVSGKLLSRHKYQSEKHHSLHKS